MLTGTMVRTRRDLKRYHHHATRVSSGCDFCKFKPEDAQVVQTYTHFWLVYNRFPYSVWDSLGVDEHLMIIPKRHVDAIGHFTPEEAKEYLELLGKYEATGYSIYARATQSKSRSITHQHTHLIKLDSKIKRVMFHVHRPYIFWFK
jgi:ATP adenylyltransferase